MHFNTETLYSYGSTVAKGAFVGVSGVAGAALGFATGAAIGAAKGFYDGARKGYGVLTAEVDRKKDDSVVVEYALKAIPAVVAPVAYGAYGAITEGAQRAYQGGKMAYDAASHYIYSNQDSSVQEDKVAAHLAQLLSEVDGETAQIKPELKATSGAYLPSQMNGKEKQLLRELAAKASVDSVIDRLSASAPALR